jgi:hypothetical protein
LSYQDDVQRLIVAGLQITQKPQLFQQVRVEVVRFVQHQYDALAGPRLLQEKIGQAQP